MVSMVWLLESGLHKMSFFAFLVPSETRIDITAYGCTLLSSISLKGSKLSTAKSATSRVNRRLPALVVTLAGIVRVVYL